MLKFFKRYSEKKIEAELKTLDEFEAKLLSLDWTDPPGLTWKYNTLSDLRVRIVKLEHKMGKK